jgi:hypothetical protein
MRSFTWSSWLLLVGLIVACAGSARADAPLDDGVTLTLERHGRDDSPVRRERGPRVWAPASLMLAGGPLMVIGAPLKAYGSARRFEISTMERVGVGFIAAGAVLVSVGAVATIIQAKRRRRWKSEHGLEARLGVTPWVATSRGRTELGFVLGGSF